MTQIDGHFGSFENNIINSLKFLELNLGTAIPKKGIFEKVSTSFPFSKNNYPITVELSIGPWESPGASSTTKEWEFKRYFEVKVLSNDRPADSSQWVFNGDIESLKSALHDTSSMVDTIKKSVDAGITHLLQNFH